MNKLFLLLSLLITWQVQAQTDRTDLQGMTLTVCGEGNFCYEIRSQKAEGSALAPLYAMKDPVFQKLDKVTREVIEEFQADNGYIDFVNDRVVLIHTKNEKSTERVYSLKNLEESNYPLGGK